MATKLFTLTPNIFGSSVVELAVCQLSRAYNFQVAPRFWENLCTHVLGKLVYPCLGKTCVPVFGRVFLHLIHILFLPSRLFSYLNNLFISS